MNYRSIACALLVACTFTATTSAAQSPFDGSRVWPLTVSAVGEDYPFALALKGSYRVFADSIVIDIASGWAVSQIPASFGASGLARSITVTASLGTGTPDSWSPSNDTPAQRIGLELGPGARIEVPRLHFVILHVDTATVSDQWLAFALGVKQHLPIKGFPDGLLYSYACTEDYVLGPTPASRVRTAAQRARYSSVC